MNVIVIGGGPAGSLAATLLARAGAAVTLLEQSRFPRDKVCGECLSALGRQVLQRHGLEGPLSVAGHELTHARLVGPSTSVRLKLPEPMLGMSRAALDHTLLNAARSAGAIIRQPARAETIESDQMSVNVRVRCLETNRVTDEIADMVLTADGRATFADRRPAATADLGVKAHFVGVTAEPEAITLYGGIGCYGGVAQIEDGRWNVAFSIPKSRVAAARGNLDAVWADLLVASPAMARHFAYAERTTDWLAAPLPRFAPLKHWPARVFPIGAAACAIEPVGGEGMGTALRSAELAVEAILADRTSSLAADYEQLWHRRSLFCRLGGRMLANERLSEVAQLAENETIARAAMWAVGK
ncbi:MAG TPA: NAD(P)/FAD-dependent oxidoreductase [Tepidisphaeraceae bacterium]|jgi:flavin-dependent dehydrogenase